MSCTANVKKGKTFVLLIRNDADTIWELAGGVTSRSYEVTNPTESTTNSSTTGDITEAQFTGFRSVSMSISGQIDTRTGTHVETGYTLAGPTRLAELSRSNEGCGKFMLIDVESGGNLEGCFNITNYSKTGETEGLMTFEASLESKSGVTFNGDI